jgi:hypothetical protein
MAEYHIYIFGPGAVQRKILSMQCKTVALIARLASVAALSAGLAATGALSASADSGPAPQSAANKQFASTWQPHSASRSPRYFLFGLALTFSSI